MNYSAPVEVTEINYLKKFGFNNIVVSIGVFDGIHLGHRAIINRLLGVAKEYCAVPVVVTFNPHPRHFLVQESMLKLLRSQKAKVELLGQLGVEAVVIVNFTEKISGMPPEQFVDYMVKDSNLKLKAICVGENWKFGAKARGDVNLLGQLAEKKGLKLYSVEQVFLDGILVSSTRIRKELASANFDIAYKMLNSNYRMEGRIIKSSPKTKCVIDYGIVPHHPGNYKIDLFTNLKTMPLTIMIDKKSIEENSFGVQNADEPNIRDRETVEIFFKP